MSELRIRDVDNNVVDQLKMRAKRNGRTLGEEVRSILADEVHRPRRDWAERLRGFRASVEEKHGVMSDSAAVIREMRDTRG